MAASPPNVGALTTASNAAGSAAKVDAHNQPTNSGSDAPSLITVEVLGYGGSSDAGPSGGAPSATPANGAEPKNSGAGGDSQMDRTNDNKSQAQ